MGLGESELASGRVLLAVDVAKKEHKRLKMATSADFARQRIPTMSSLPRVMLACGHHYDQDIAVADPGLLALLKDRFEVRVLERLDYSFAF